MLGHSRCLLKAIDRQIQLHGDPGQFLFQRVVKLAGNPVALFEYRAAVPLLANHRHLLVQSPPQYDDPH